MVAHNLFGEIPGQERKWRTPKAMKRLTRPREQLKMNLSNALQSNVRLIYPIEANIQNTNVPRRLLAGSAGLQRSENVALVMVCALGARICLKFLKGISINFSNRNDYRHCEPKQSGYFAINNINLSQLITSVRPLDMRHEIRNFSGGSPRQKPHSWKLSHLG